MSNNPKSNDKGGHDLTTHHLIEIREPPSNLVALRNELMEPAHESLARYASQGATFEECLGRIGVQLSIAFDGDYDANTLCGILCTALRNKRFGFNSSELERIPGLMEVELHEREGEVELVDMEAARAKEEGERETKASKPSKIILN